MKMQIIRVLAVGMLVAVPVAGIAATQKASTAKHTATSTAATHSMKGVVKSIDDRALVLTSSGGSHAETSFTLNSSTHREGTIAPGSTVSVRYHDEGTTHVATAIGVEHAKKPAAHSTPKH